MLGVLLMGLGEYQDVVEVDKLVKHIPNTSLIRAWKTAGTSESPSGITRYS